MAATPPGIALIPPVSRESLTAGASTKVDCRVKPQCRVRRDACLNCIAIKDCICALAGGGLWEIRCELMQGRISRILFCVHDGRMVLLHAFIKKTQKTPDADLALALKRKKEIT
jgi:hypothetical protein